MEVVWDERKRQVNLRRHGLDFAAARDRFAFEEAMIEPSRPARDGRARFVAVGRLDGNIITLIFSTLGTEAVSLISLRRASRRERKRHAEAQIADN